MTTYRATIDVSAQSIADMMIGAIEGGSTGWCGHIDLGGKDYSKAETYENPFAFTVTDDDGDVTVMDNISVQKGIELMAGDFPTHFADMMQEEWDAETADVFFQLCALGELVYG
jgi:hypothetical protein